MNTFPRRLSILLESLCHVPEGSLTFRSRSFTKFVLADGVLAGSVHAAVTLKSGAPLGTWNDHPHESPVSTESPSTKEACIAVCMSRIPQPSCSYGAVSPAPFVFEEYCPVISCALAVSIALIRALEGSA